MKPASYHGEQNQYHFFRKERFPYWAKAASFLFYSTYLAMALSSFYFLYYSTKINYTQQIQDYNDKTKTFIQPKNDSEKCDLFKGKWIPDPTGPLLYTNYSCKTIPSNRNCLLHGRKDTDFLHWRWKPDQCELPRFRPEVFLSTLRGKTMAFIGDSLARNHMESLLCLLSSVETPLSIYKDVENQFTTWEFSKHNFTLMVLWSQFLVTANIRSGGSKSGPFDLILDKVDTNWLEKLPSIDYAIFSNARWFLRENYLYEGDSLIGCIFCQTPNVKDLGAGIPIRKAFQAAFKEINNCKNCKKIFTILQTYSPSHFEGGEWNTGGECNKTRPTDVKGVDKSPLDWKGKKIVLSIKLATSPFLSIILAVHPNCPLCWYF